MNIQLRRFRSLAALATFAFLLTIASAASAQTHSSTTDNNWTDTRQNLCVTPTDTVFLQGRMHLVINQSTNNDGTVHLIFNMDQKGAGQGDQWYGNPPQQLSYNFSGSTKSNGKFPASPDGQPTATFREFDRLISKANVPGVPDNMYLLTTTRLYKDGTSSSDFDIRCHG